MSDPRPGARRVTPLFERINRSITTYADCWQWTGAIATHSGYGTVSVDGKTKRAHRVTYEMWKGPIPAGLELDHLCRNRACVRPDHLEAVSKHTNMLRGISWAAENARKTQCPYGHEYTAKNTAFRRQGWRRCLACTARRRKARKLRKREERRLAAIPPRSDR